MNILMVSNVFPLPTNTGGLIRIFQILKGLSEFHEVTFISPLGKVLSAEDHQSELSKRVNARIHVVPWRRRTLADKAMALASRRPYHVSLYRCPALSDLVTRLVNTQPFDLIYIHFLRSLQYIPPDVAIPVVLDQHNVDRDMWSLRSQSDPQVFTRRLSRLNLVKTIGYEDASLNRIYAYVSVSNQDMFNTQMYARPVVQRFIVAPNGVDTDYFTAPICRIHQDRNNGHARTVAFLGSMDLQANIDAVHFLYDEVIPLVMRYVKRMRLIIIGRNPPLRIRSLSSKEGLEVVVTGTVEDVRTYLRQADIFVAPLLYGGGTKLKVLQAMAMQIPVIATPHAAHGLEVSDGAHLLIGDTREALAEKVVQLVDDEGLRCKIGQQGGRLVRELYSWQAITQRLAQELEALI